MSSVEARKKMLFIQLTEHFRFCNSKIKFPQQLNSSQLTPRDIPVFEGGPLKFNIFTEAFKHYVEEKGTACNIWKDTTGGLCKTVCTCVQKEVLKQLKPSYKHFGNKTKMTAAYMEEGSQLANC